MIATFRSRELPLVVIVTNDRAKFGDLQQRLAGRCVFFVCGSECEAVRVAREELVGGWLLDSSSRHESDGETFGLGWRVAARLAGLSAGHRVALVDESYDAQCELAAYERGAFYVCGQLPVDWLVSFLGNQDVGCQEELETTAVVAP